MRLLIFLIKLRELVKTETISTCFTKEISWPVRKVNKLVCFESFPSLKALP